MLSQVLVLKLPRYQKIRSFAGHFHENRRVFFQTANYWDVNINKISTHFSNKFHLREPMRDTALGDKSKVKVDVQLQLINNNHFKVTTLEPLHIYL